MTKITNLHCDKLICNADSPNIRGRIILIPPEPAKLDGIKNKSSEEITLMIIDHVGGVLQRLFSKKASQSRCKGGAK